MLEQLKSHEQVGLKQMGSRMNGVDVTGPVGERLADPDFADHLKQLSNDSRKVVIDFGHLDREVMMGWTGGSLPSGRSLAAGFTPTPGMGQSPMQEIVPLQAPLTSFLDLVPSSRSMAQLSVRAAAVWRSEAGADRAGGIEACRRSQLPGRRSTPRRRSLGSSNERQQLRDIPGIASSSSDRPDAGN